MGDLIEALKSYQQADEDGVMVLVSRQAVDEAIGALQQPRLPDGYSAKSEGGSAAIYNTAGNSIFWASWPSKEYDLINSFLRPTKPEAEKKPESLVDGWVRYRGYASIEQMPLTSMQVGLMDHLWLLRKLDEERLSK